MAGETRNSNSFADAALSHTDGLEFLLQKRRDQIGTSGSSLSNIDIGIHVQPEKIVDVSLLADGYRSYRVRWKDSWIHEQHISSYQHLVNDYWSHQEEEKAADDAAGGGPLKVDFAVDDGQKSAADADCVPLESGHAVNVILVEEDDGASSGRSTEMVVKNRVSADLTGGLLAKDENEKLSELSTSSLASSVDASMSRDYGKTPSSTVKKSKCGKKRKGKSDKLFGSTKKCMRGMETDLVAKAMHQVKIESEEKENLSSRLDLDPDNPSDDDDDSMNAFDDSSELEFPEGSRHEVGGGEDTAPISPVQQVEFSRRRKLRDRKEKMSDERGPVQCGFCDKVLASKYGLREHLSVVHYKNGKFQCELCGKRVTNNRALKLHMTSHSTERQHVCELCGSSHKTKGNLSYHMKTMHTMIKNFRCDLCFKTFKVQAELKDHCFQHHANEGVITCIVCKKKLTTALSIYTHSVMHSGAREFECDICGYAFKTFTGLKEHKVTHLDQKPVRQCPHCDRKFLSRSQYNAHVMRHTTEGALITYQCPVCDVKFQHKSSYNRHVIRHQPGGDKEFPKENPYQYLDESELPEGVCHKCRKFYNSKSGFYMHLKKCRDGIVQKFPCLLCERTCSNRSSLKRHMQRRHAGEFDGRDITSVHDQEMAKDGREMEAARQASVIATHDMQSEGGIHYHANFFDGSYTGQLTTVDGTPLTTVDVQLLLETAAAAQGEGQLLSAAQLQAAQGATSVGPLQILTESEAAQIIADAAQLQQQGVIVGSNGANQQPTRIIVSTGRMDAHGNHIIVSECHPSQLLGRTAPGSQDHMQANASGDALIDQHVSHDGEPNGMHSQSRVLQYNQPTVIRIHHSHAQVGGLGNRQVLSVQGKSIGELGPEHEGVAELGQDIQMEAMVGDELPVSDLVEDRGVEELSQGSSGMGDVDSHLSVMHSSSNFDHDDPPTHVHDVTVSEGVASSAYQRL